MRPQAKRFTVEKRKTRKSRTEDQSELGLMRVKPKSPETVMRSPSFVAADRAFGRMAPSRSPVRLGTEGADSLFVTARPLSKTQVSSPVFAVSVVSGALRIHVAVM